ncbi:endonuclease/exonuclease/phosphatase family protein [Aureitalea marina]|uniref:Endonuclease/exonuclease/phosphatase domain-containing protein n=1 Tax=Aureitalea marina TaxID=930804 RepID=A0A2S7KPY7_9FLAO|nr:endonuclease/exonuclease/phosphatase family protein [Aureitalea marina]PQB04692.1 hypothetical protein BST85_07135 [Aureitalea marina]
MSKRRSGFLGRIIYGINILAALLLLISYLVPYVPPARFPSISLIGLAVSPLIVINLLFLLYWLVGFRRQSWLSGTVLLLGFLLHGPLYRFGSNTELAIDGPHLKVMSYNVRLFNAYEEEPGDVVDHLLDELIQEHQPDVICIQEYYKEHPVDFSQYPYQFTHFRDGSALGYAIFSKYPMTAKGSFDFDDTGNNSVYTDLEVGGNKLRLYNLHLQSLGILPTVDYLQNNDSERTRKRMADGFARQQEQLEVILEHMTNSPYPILVGADLNNTPFSYVYRKLNKQLVDGFREEGRGLGTTFRFDSYPLRIDYLFADSSLKFLDFQTLDRTFSDHYPVMATLKLP